jgi:hypothetical protein
LSTDREAVPGVWGTYRYTVKGKSVSFVVIKDPCKQRAEVLGKTWTRRH